MDLLTFALASLGIATAFGVVLRLTNAAEAIQESRATASARTSALARALANVRHSKNKGKKAAKDTDDEEEGEVLVPPLLEKFEPFLRGLARSANIDYDAAMYDGDEREIAKVEALISSKFGRGGGDAPAASAGLL